MSWRRDALAVATFAGLVAVAGASSVATAQQPGADAAVLSTSLRPATRLAIEQLADSMRRTGLPAAPLYAKANEGVLKGATNARILGAIEALAQELGEARAALGTAARDEELVAGAGALHAGVGVDVLRRLRASAGASPSPSSIAVPLVVLSDLVSRRVPATVALSSLESLLAHRASDAEYTLLRDRVERDIEQGRPPAASMTTHTRTIIQTLDARRPDNENGPR